MLFRENLRAILRKHWVHIPCVGSILFVLAMLSDTLRPHLLPWVRENGPIELMTFGLALAAGLFGFIVARKASRSSASFFTGVFLYLFATGSLLVALEEIAWGQTFLNYNAPSYFLENNAQQEVTLHNLNGMHGASDYLCMVFGLTGLIGLYGFRGEKWAGIAVPPRLFSLLVTITAGSVLSVAQGIWYFSSPEFALGRKLAELLELWVALAAFLYAWHHFRASRKKT